MDPKKDAIQSQKDQPRPSAKVDDSASKDARKYVSPEHAADTKKPDVKEYQGQKKNFGANAPDREQAPKNNMKR